MCNACGVYILDHDNLPDIAAALEGINLERRIAESLVKDGYAAAGVLNFHGHGGNNRGIDSAGIVTLDESGFNVYKGMGLVEQVFRHDDMVLHERILRKLPGSLGVGHDRYSTKGRKMERNVQPLIAGLAIAHNGNILNEAEIRQQLMAEGITPATTTDSELIGWSLYLELQKGKSVHRAVHDALEGDRRFVGAYSVVAAYENNLIAFKDPYGFWPLHVARFGNLVVVNSEINPILEFADAMKYRNPGIRSLENGELVVINKDTQRIRLSKIFKSRPKLEHVFDFFYLRSYKDPESSRYRAEAGKLLWEKFGVAGDISDYVAVGSPESGILYAQGFVGSSGVGYDQGLIGKIDNRLRTFQITPDAQGRRSAKDKYTYPSENQYIGKKIILFDDSIVRSRTIDHHVRQLSMLGVDEIHVRIGSAPITNPDFLGIHISTYDELIAHHLSEKQIEQYFEARFYGADYEFKELTGMIRGLGKNQSIEGIIKQSRNEGKNFLAKERKYEKGKFSVKYLSGTKEDPLAYMKEAFTRAGINHNKIFFGPMVYGAYPGEMKPYLPKAT